MGPGEPRGGPLLDASVRMVRPGSSAGGGGVVGVASPNDEERGGVHERPNGGGGGGVEGRLPKGVPPGVITGVGGGGSSSSSGGGRSPRRPVCYSVSRETQCRKSQLLLPRSYTPRRASRWAAPRRASRGARGRPPGKPCEATSGGVPWPSSKSAPSRSLGSAKSGLPKGVEARLPPSLKASFASSRAANVEYLDGAYAMAPAPRRAPRARSARRRARRGPTRSWPRARPRRRLARGGPAAASSWGRGTR